ncbi:UNVERIFIED_CONTAM: putative membrane protein [Sesamum radiatum]|uniref:Membrane protein n=1 Tax=Sesamum radiatum TaxID=300843 RepID=A0AAW2P484_SESRA
MSRSLKDWVETIYVVLAFCSVLCFGALKSLLVGPIAGLVLIIGNLGVILGLFPAHVAWTVYTLLKTNRFDAPLKVAILLGLPALFGIWLALSIAGSVLVGVGYGFFTPWVSSFEAFRLEKSSKKCYHCIVDGTWGTIKGSCTVVRDFADLCYHSYPIYLKELRENPSSNELQPLRFIHVPACIIVGLMGLVVEIPLYTAIAIVKSPFMLFKGWHRLLHDLISREGPFLETACIPIAGLTILMWPLVVIGSILLATFTSFFIGLYGSVIVYQERSFRRGVAYVIAMVAEFDEYTNDWLYLREGSILPKPRYRKRKPSNSSETTISRNQSVHERFGAVIHEASGMLVPSLTASRSVREAIKEVKMVQDRLLDWFFHPVMVLKEQIRALRLEEGEIQYLEKVMLFGNNKERAKSWENGSLVPQDALRAAQIEGISRRMMGMTRSVSKFPTYRRRYRQVVKDLINYSMGKESSSKAVAYTLTKDGSTRSVTSSTAKESSRSMSVRSVASVDIV